MILMRFEGTTSVRRIASYDELAAEYYDPVRHPTCSDFRRASRVLLEDFVRQLEYPTLPLLEVGAGMSLVAELFTELQIPLDEVTLNDASRPMLQHSAIWFERGATPLVGRVEELSRADRSFEVICACLGDPYNTPGAWRSISRMLARGGSFFFTVPSFEWVTYFRQQPQRGLEDVAEFEVVGGKQVYVPSVVLPDDQQIALIEASGLHVTRVRHLAVGEIPGGADSSKLTTPRGDEMPAVVAFMGVKQ